MLPGVSRQVTIQLCERLGLKVEEKNLDLFDAYNADEIFITSTSFCICPVQSINGRLPFVPSCPGPLTESLIKAYVDLVDFDWYTQYLDRL